MGYKAKRCRVCGKTIRPQYEMCFDCYRRNLGQPKRCKLCGTAIPDKYIYCWSCALHKKKLFKEGVY